MVRKAYADMVATQVEEILGDGYEVKVVEITKNNNIKKTGITITSINSNITPNIYIDEMQDEGLTTASAAKEVVRIYKANEDKTPKIDVDDIMNIFTNEDRLLKAVLPKLVNANQSDEYISIPFLDMKILFYIRPTEISTITLTKKQTEIEPERLLRAARENMTTFKQDLHEMLGGMGFPMFFGGGPKIYVCTNEAKTLGAACLLDSEFIDDIAREFNDDVAIFPSSIHEVICASASEMEGNPMVTMVRDINRDVVDPTEVLSDNVYIYRRETGEIEIIKED